MTLAIILLSVLCSSAAHLVLKVGATQVFAGAMHPGAMGMLIKVLANPVILLGLCLHGVALVTWIYALGRVEVSYAYPFIAVGFVLVALFSWAFMHETMNAYRVGGIALIVLGVQFVARS